MSTDADDEPLSDIGVPELTSLGKRIEILRLERRMSKRVLAQRAGTSRQQLWRVMTGKSELTGSLCLRLAEVLDTDSRSLRDATAGMAEVGNASTRTLLESRLPAVLSVRATAPAPVAFAAHPRTFEDYVASPAALEQTFATLPAGTDGRRLKRVLLDAIEDLAIARGLKLPPAIFDLRRTVVNDDA